MELSNGVKLPSQGLGTYTLNQKTMISSMRAAFESGCCLVDTASSYNNEHLVGNAVKILEDEGLLKRKDLFIQTKVGDKIDETGHPIGYFFYNSLSCPCHDTKKVVYGQIENSLKQLRTDYLDLVMIHWPYYDVLNEIWAVLEELYEQKIIRSIGVSNCKKRHLEKLMRTANIAPMVNQINISPINICKEDYVYCKDNKIVIQAYSPLYTIKYLSEKSNKTIDDIAEKYSKTPSQILLRWYMEKGIVALPKSANSKRVKENYNIFDFQLNNNEIEIIDSLNCDYNYLVESVFCPGY